MPDQWVYSEPPERQPQTQFALRTPQGYSQTEHLAQMNGHPQDPRLTPGGPQPAFRPSGQPRYPSRQAPSPGYGGQPDPWEDASAWQQAQRPAFAGRPQPPASQPWRKTGLTAAEQFWYVLMCISFAAGYFAKIPVKKALSDFGLAEMTAAEKFWYVLTCIPMGAGYFCKVPVAKAIEDMQLER
jgi:hypothetical protein